MNENNLRKTIWPFKQLFLDMHIKSSVKSLLLYKSEIVYAIRSCKNYRSDDRRLYHVITTKS